MLKVLLVANYPPDRQVSMLRFADLLEQGLLARGIRVERIAPRPVLFPGVSRADGVWKWIGYVNKFLVFPARLRRRARHADLVHICDHSNAMYVPFIAAAPHVVTCHDVIAIKAARDPQNPWAVGPTGRVFQALILAGLRRARAIACVSAHTRAELATLAPDPEALIRVVHNGLNYPYAPSDEVAIRRAVETSGVGNRPFLIHVGSDHPRKNRAFVVRLFAAVRARYPELALQLVLVGAAPTADVRPLIDALGLADHVRCLGEVDNATLQALYTRATALVFPSLFEGFGWPIIEAQACGCPAVVSDRLPMTEIGGDAALRIDPTDLESATARVVAAFPDLGQARAASRHNAARFSATRMIDRYLDLYAALIDVAPAELVRVRDG